MFVNSRRGRKACRRHLGEKLTLWNILYSTPRASKVHCSINGLENSSSPEYSKVQHLFGIAVGLFSAGVGLFLAGVGLFPATVGLGKSPPPTKKSPPPVEKSPPLTQKSPTLTEKSNLKKVLLRPKKVLLQRKKSPTLTEVTYNKDEKILYIFTSVLQDLEIF